MPEMLTPEYKHNLQMWRLQHASIPGIHFLYLVMFGIHVTISAKLRRVIFIIIRFVKNYFRHDSVERPESDGVDPHQVVHTCSAPHRCP
jgi:hypothetical protein